MEEMRSVLGNGIWRTWSRSLYSDFSFHTIQCLSSREDIELVEQYYSSHVWQGVDMALDSTMQRTGHYTKVSAIISELNGGSSDRTH